ncbi:MAG: hypothetical protein GY713_22445 [Actinomycetia bacterium]|nr:hypothetical protein [Actinomycetes bacterium]MCP3913694.1 hypothetical protein [Actinomycetes bacterium]
MLALLGLPNIVLAAAVTAVVAVVFHRQVFGVCERTETSWSIAWLKAAVILVFITFAGVYLPSWAMQTSMVSDLGREAQDLAGSVVWGAAIVVTIGGLAYLHRHKRV